MNSADLEVRSLSPEDRADLEGSTSLSGLRMPWAEVIQEMVRDFLADALERGTEGLGLWRGDSLLGVTAWTENEPRVWRSSLVAVRSGYAHRGYGRRLKQEQIRLGLQAGIERIISTIHRDNDPMIELSREFDAKLDPYPGDWDHLVCTINTLRVPASALAPRLVVRVNFQ